MILMVVSGDGQRETHHAVIEEYVLRSNVMRSQAAEWVPKMASAPLKAFSVECSELSPVETAT